MKTDESWVVPDIIEVPAKRVITHSHFLLHLLRLTLALCAVGRCSIFHCLCRRRAPGVSPL